MTSLKLKDIKKDQVFYECERGMNIKMTALEDAHIATRVRTQGYVCNVRDDEGDEFELFEALDAGSYALRLSDAPVYGRVA